MNSKLIASRISAYDAIKMIGGPVRLGPGMEAAHGVHDILPPNAVGIVVNLCFRDNWPVFIVAFGEVVLDLLDFEIEVVAQ